ncbi:MAG: M20/M25/M40 family metallo-hydrolase [Deltaproteobacteria bacterium]|nr:M20/M25/M40 family metallo-hydrolase [Deltaproteobacteria bacterium]
MQDLSPSIRHLRDLVAIPSVNPMGRDDLPAEVVGEQAMAEHVAAALGRLGMDATLVGRNGRISVLAEARVSSASDTLLIASHIDTVPVDGMEIDPFDPVIEDDRVLGRGACDTKAGMAALLEALARVLERGTLRRHVIVVGEADEELGSIGVTDVLEHLGDRRPDWVLATEPTDLRLINAHKGVVHARIVARGRACHSSDPLSGSNAIVTLARAILAIERGARLFSSRPHPQLGPATLSVGVIRGGQAPNIVPDRAEIWVDRRTLPDESASRNRSELDRRAECGRGPGIGRALHSLRSGGIRNRCGCLRARWDSGRGAGAGLDRGGPYLERVRPDQRGRDDGAHLRALARDDCSAVQKPSRSRVSRRALSRGGRNRLKRPDRQTDFPSSA